MTNLISVVPELYSWAETWRSFISAQIFYSTLLCLPVAALTVWRGRRWAFVLHGLWLVVLLRLLLPPGFSAPWSLSGELTGWAITGDAGIFLTSSDAGDTARAHGAAAGTTRPTFRWYLSLILASAWLLGVLLTAAHYCRRSWRVFAQLRAARPVTDPDLLRRVEFWRRRFGVRRPIELITAGKAGAPQPFTVGSLKPKIYLPSALIEAADSSVIESVIAHETAHIQRWDYFWLRVQGWLQVFYFFHPVMWIAAGQLNRMRETLCDQLVLAEGTVDRHDYGRSLVTVLELQAQRGRARTLPIPALATERRQRQMRLEQILHCRLPGAWQRKAAAAATLLMALLLLPMAPTSQFHAKAQALRTDIESQKQTVMDMRRISTAFRKWSEEANQRRSFEPIEKKAIELRDNRFSVDSFRPLSATTLNRLLVPKYLDHLATEDGWGNPLELRTDTAEVHPNMLLIMRSPGRDREIDGPSYPVSGFEFDQFDRDLVHVDGYFLTWPTSKKDDP